MAISAESGQPLNAPLETGEVMLNGVLSNAVPITPTSTAPSAFGEPLQRLRPAPLAES
jgi:hypothetical protein